MSKTTAIINQKGGVGKTTTALNLSYVLSENREKVLLIDFDPQASLTAALGYNADNKINIQTLMAAAIEENELEEDYIINIKDNLDLIPCSLELAGIEMSLVNVMSREMVLKSVIENIEDNYDHIIIDCSPSLGMLTINALAACNSIIIPVTPEYLSAKGLGLLINNISKIRKKINPNLTVDGILITMINERTHLSKEMTRVLNESVDSIKNKFNLDMKVFQSKIPISVKVGEAIMNRKSIIEYNPKNKVSESYKDFAREWREW
ncbi:chromosome partitioning protein ParA [Tissierella sp. P1]|uniref:ParA family protein n=1 Tax=Tissierella sp. P1 TaxID=1280483 RepID=UPI000BA068EE|nr:ParA family protein [Tissierella sp. P1]OZV13475.1 chromosome partitioning protein ParA [Tissierella sp. P1]